MASTGDRPYDPYIPSEPAAGGAGAQPAPGNQRTAALQAVSNYFFRRRPTCRWTDSQPMDSEFDAMFGQTRRLRAKAATRSVPESAKQLDLGCREPAVTFERLPIESEMEF
jgi:hypothetical protein